MASSCKSRRLRLPIVLSSVCLTIHILTTVYCWADDSLTASSKPDISLIRISPEGDNVRRPSEIVLQFSAPVIPLGRMERTPQEIKIEIAPSLTCQWRWTSTSALTCHLDERSLPTRATQYSITVPRDFDTTRGEVLPAPVTHSFTTERPAVASSWFTNWTSPGSPSIGLTTNQKVAQEELSKHLFFEDKNSTRYNVRVAEMTPQSTEEGAPEAPDEMQRYDKTRWIVAPESELPVDTAVALKVTPGLRSLEGKEVGIEDRVVQSFFTFPELAFVGVSCRDLQGQEVWIPAAAEAAQQTNPCDPLNIVQLAFNAPVLKEQLRNSIISSPDLRGGRVDFDPWEDVFSYSRLKESHTKDQRYYLNLPYGLKARATYSLRAHAGSISDEFGRALAQDISISFKTGHRAPRFVMDNTFSVLEKDSDSQVPVVVTNLDSLTLSYQTVTADSNTTGLTTRLTPFKAQDIAYHFPINVRELLRGRSGILQGTITTQPKTEEGRRWFFSQVTPYAAHLKLGHFNSLIWITSLATGEAIAGATVSVIVTPLTSFVKTPKTLAVATTDERGIALLPGTEALDPTHQLLNEWENKKPRLMVRVEKDGELAVLPVSWDLEVYGGEVYPRTERQHGHIHAWGTTSQGLYKAGDSVQFALWVRDQNNEQFVAAPRSGYSLQVLDPTDKVVFEASNITLSDFGSYHGSFTTAKNAAVGWYRFLLRLDASKQSWQPLRVLISDFTPAPFKVSAETNAERFQQGDTVTVHTQARLHAGGPYSDAAIRVTAHLRGAAIKTLEPQLERFFFESDTEKDRLVFQKEENLDSKGDHSASFVVNESNVPYGNLVIESAVRDDRGKFVATVTRAPFIARDLLVGVYQKDWVLHTGREATIESIVIDSSKSTALGAAHTIAVHYEDTKASRVKSAGNTYVSKYEKEFVPVHQCDLVSAREARTCSFTPSKPGRYRITGSVKDAKGGTHSSTIYRWASGAGEVVWESSPNNDLPILPEKKSYTVGETARFFIRNPLPGAKALLTTERYGVQRSWVETWSDTSTVVEVPITKEHIPGFYFSATVMSPRVDTPLENQVDLGKPSFKLGYAEISVFDRAHQLTVEVTPQAQVYKPRDTVTVGISARTHEGKNPPMEYAVTVLDEGVFDLIAQGRDYFDPHRGFYSLDGLDLRNFNLIKMLIGRQKFEKKGATAGGDGGANLDLRSLKKFVSYWNPALRPDANGKATITFEAPDNLTGWKVFVMAFTEAEQMGLGEARFTVNKDTEIRSALPNQVRQNDSFTSTFTVMNRTEATRTLTVETRVEGAAIEPTDQLKRTIVAEPFTRYPISTRVKAGTSEEVRLTVKAYDIIGSDAVSGTVPILSPAAIRTVANFGSSDGTSVTEPVSIPSGIAPGMGSIGVVVSPSLLGSLDGAVRYLKDYPYGCWEQKLSRAIAAMHAERLKGYLPKSFTWPNSSSVITETLSEIGSFQAPNGGMSFFLPQDEYVSQYLSAYTALALTWLKDAGATAPINAESRLHAYLLNLLKNEDFPSFYSLGMRSSVRAVALAALARSGAIKLNDLLRYKSTIPTMSVVGKAHYLQAAVTLGASPDLLNTVINQLLSHGSESGERFTLTDSVETEAGRILDSSMRSHCVALDTLLSALKKSGSTRKARIESLMPKLARTITLERTRKDRWENTQENAFCLTALMHYSAVYEKEAPDLNLGVSVGSEQLARVSLQSFRAEPLEVSRSLTAQDAGRSEAVHINATGKGRFYYSTRLAYAPQTSQTSAMNAGMEVVREYSVQRNGSWVALGNPISVKQGELVKVDLFVRLRAPRAFVVVEDPVPGGFEAVNRDLATSSSIDDQSSGFAGPMTSIWWNTRDWFEFGSNLWSFYHRELRHSAARFYSEYLPAGNYHLSYVSQAIAPGRFIIPPTHAEEMYHPEVFGESAPGTLVVEPQ